MNQTRLFLVTILILSMLSITILNQATLTITSATNTAITINNSRTFTDKGISLSNVGKCNEAMVYFNQSLEINPNDIRAMDGKGSCLDHFGKYKEAVGYFNQVLEINPNDANALKNKNLAMLHITSAQKSNTSATNTAITINNSRTFTDKGISLSNVGKCNEAMVYFNQSLEINPNDIRAMDGKGSCLDHFGKYKEAVGYFNQVLEINPNDANALKNKNLAMLHITSAQKSNTSATNTACVQLQSLNRENLPSSPGLIANGSINSVLNLAKDLRYVASGNWHLVDDGSNANFSVNMIWYPNTPTNSSAAKVHTHAIQNFQLQPGQHIIVQPNNILIKGCADVLTNSKVIWRNIPISIKILGDTIDISFTGNDQTSTNAKNHFANQDTLGVVKAITECSDQPLPNMVILPACNMDSSTISTYNC